MPGERGVDEAPQESTGRRRRLLVILTLAQPLILLSLLEIGLRVVGFGGSFPLFIDAPGMPGYLYANPEVVRRYATTSGDPVAVIEPIALAKHKPKDGYRIVVQGGSTAAGFPYGRWAGLAGMLGDRLETVFPDREIEVVTTAMAAVNSYTLDDLVDEIVEVEPDAVLVYAGHNEFLGILGVGSALTPENSRSAIRLHLRLRRLRIYQLIHRLIASVARVPAMFSDGDRNTLFSQAAAGALIPFGSETYQAGLRQFEANLGELLRKYQDAGIPVYIGTLVGNEKDLAPFVGGPVGEVKRASWERELDAARAQRKAGEPDAARRRLQQLIEVDERAADPWFALGQVEQDAGRFEEARQAYRAAVDRDQLRLRAPEAFNRIIRELAQRFGATLVDVQQHFADASPGGIVGNELLLEHVHPNAEGYFLLADAYYEALKRDGRIGDWSREPSREQARRDLPITALDRVLAAYDMRELKAGYPFSDPPQHLSPRAPRGEIERIAQQFRAGEIDWIHSMEQLLQIHLREGRTAAAARVARLVAQAYPADQAPNYSAGVLLARVSRFALARRYLERSLRAAPGDVPTLTALIRVEVALHDPVRTRAYLEALERVAPTHPLVRRHHRRGAAAPAGSDPHAPGGD